MEPADASAAASPASTPMSDEEFEAAYRSGRMRIDTRVFAGMVPALVFLVVRQVASPQIAIVSSFVASAAVFARYPGRGVIRALAVLAFAVVTASTIIGLLSESETAFVAQNIVSDVIFVGVGVGTVLARKPLIGAIAREVAPGIAPVVPVDHPVFVRLTLLNVAISAVTAAIRLGMLAVLSTAAYVIVSRVVFFPVSVLFIAYCYRETTRATIRMWPADAPPPEGWRPHARA
ncbi:MAG TPA: hypothetical protein VFC53_14065 [Dehalococcoidia bacterium]|nr:hypothetical protein [Dehalococcoidia bacterium]